MDNNTLIDRCIEFGAYRAAIVKVSNIIFDPALRKACEANFCGNFGKNHGCPPGIGEADELIGRAKSYEYALVFQTVTELEDSFDFEGMTAAAVRHSEIAARVDTLMDAPHLQLTAGGCNLCERCAGFDNEPCRRPGEAVSSLEAYCIHVAKLAGKCGMQYINGKDTVTYFAAFLY